MKTLLRRIKRSLVCRLCYRLVCWINYPTSRERMWHMYDCGKKQGIKEALARLPITRVQPAVPKKVVIQPLKHLPPGMVLAQWLQTHGLSHRAAIPSQHEPVYWPEPFEAQMIKSGKNGHENAPGLASEVTSGQLINDDLWLNSKPQPKLEGDPTESMPAIVRLRHELHRKA